jgi:hypothetical protein
MQTYFAEGVIRYKGEWITLQCPNDVVNYYKFWVEKFLGKKISTSYHEPHVTVLAGKYEKGLDKHPLWGKYQGRRVEFEYDSTIHTDAPWFTQGKYFWLRVHCPFLRHVRRELGLKPTPYHPYHLTIGYCGY